MPHSDPEERKAYRREYMREYREKYPEKGREASRKYRESHPEEVRKIAIERQESGRMWKSIQKWRENNPEQWAAVGHRYRARLRDVSFEDTTLYRAIIKFDPCSYCGKVADQIDHIRPLILGGTETEDNLTASCQSCNSRKKDRPLLIWMLDACTTS